MSEPFTWEWVRETIVRLREEGIELDRAACERIAAEFNRAYTREHFVEVWDAPHVFWAASRMRAGESIRPTATIHPQNSKNERRWARHVLAMGNAVRKELRDANPKRKPPFGYTPDGLIAQMLELVIPLITQEHPTAGAIAKELERQQKLRSG